MTAAELFGPFPEALARLRTRGPGPAGKLPLTEAMLREAPSGDLFGMTQNAGMGWNPSELGRKQFLILSTQGGIRAEDGRPIALGYHTGHWEIGLLSWAAAETFREGKALPFAAYVSDPCDGRTQGTVGMFDSLPFRNDAAIVFRRLIRSLPQRVGVLGVATCDKGLPAMMMALASQLDLPTVLVPGGVTLPPERGEDAGTVQTLGARFSHGLVTLDEAADLGCRACGTPGGGCQFLGTAATSQVVAEALGLALPHSALAPSGEPIWLQLARDSARALMAREAAGLRRPTVDDWIAINRRTPRLVSVMPNGPTHHPTVRAFLAGGVPEVMLHLRDLGLLDLEALTATGDRLGETLDAWARSERRSVLRQRLQELDGVDPDSVILPPALARERGLTSTVTFPRGNLAPEGAVIKSTSIDPAVLSPEGVFFLEGPARVFTREREAITAIKAGHIRAGDVLVLAGVGPMGTGMEETYQLTSALKHLPFGKYVALITDARFSGVSTGACIGHVGPEALAGGPIGRVRDGDRIRIRIDCRNLEGSLDLVGDAEGLWEPGRAEVELQTRSANPALAPHEKLPADTRLWAALVGASGGTWGGCVYDVDSIVAALERAH